MARNHHFHFKQFSVHQQHCAMKVSTDACLFGAFVDVSTGQRILDIGTGTGLLALMVAQRSSATIEAVELDASAAAQAKKNAEESPWADRIHVRCSSIQDFVRSSPDSYDTIICNPPFFTNHTASPCPLRHQARHNDALSFDELSSIASQLLTEKGTLHVLLPVSEQHSFLATCREHSLYLSRSVEICPTPNKQASRVILSLSFCEKEPDQTDLIKTSLCIHGENGYSKEFSQLLKPFYLKL